MKCWILTIPCSEVSKRELLFRLRRRAKRWQFGIEMGTHSGYKHYQVRYECSNNDYETERRYWQGIKCELQEAGGWSDYECKDGNFYTSLDDHLGKYRFSRLKELQLLIDSHRRKQTDRTITAVIDKTGGIGKTFYARWMCLNGNGIYINGTGTEDRIIASAYDRAKDGKNPCFFIDISRNTNQNRSDIWGAIECIKNGYLADGRYAHRDKWISPPHIIVFANREPDWNLLSADRWDKIFIKRREDGKLKVWHNGEYDKRTF